MQPIKRTSDVLQKTKMEDLGCFKSFPVYMGCVSNDPTTDLFSDMKWHISPVNGLLQLKELIPLDILYRENHAGAVGKIWMDHHAAFAEFIKQYSPTSVLEIGGAHGILSKIYQQSSQDVTWSIVEPNPIPVEGVTAHIYRDFFDENFRLDYPVDAVVHSHVFEHVYDPKAFVHHISTFLKEGDYLLFSLPNMEEMLRRKYTNCINFEHTVFLTEPYVEFLLRQFGFKILERHYFLEDHSIFYACLRTSCVEEFSLPSGLYETNKQLFLDYQAYHHSLVSELNRKIADLNQNQRLFLFGAHVFSQYLFGFGLDPSKIEYILDNDTMKQGKRLYGTNLAVASPSILADVPAPVVILKAGAYNSEIMQDILMNINSKTEFI